MGQINNVCNILICIVFEEINVLCKEINKYICNKTLKCFIKYTYLPEESLKLTGIVAITTRANVKEVCI